MGIPDLMSEGESMVGLYASLTGLWGNIASSPLLDTNGVLSAPGDLGSLGSNEKGD